MQIDFDSLQMKPLLYELISQTVLPCNESTMKIEEGDVLDISFNNTSFKDYKLLITNVSFTSLDKLKNNDISKNGFVYRPAFINFMQNFRNVDAAEGSVVKLDFKLLKRERVNFGDY